MPSYSGGGGKAFVLAEPKLDAGEGKGAMVFGMCGNGKWGVLVESMYWKVGNGGSAALAFPSLLLE